MGIYRSTNQRLVTVQNEKFTKEYSEDAPYGMIRHSSNDRAAKELSPTAYKMFVKFALNRDGYKFALSPKALEETIGIKETAYRKAFEQLNELGYIIPVPDVTDEYIFLPNPPRVEALDTDMSPVEYGTPPVKSEGVPMLGVKVEYPKSEGGDYRKTEEPPVECEGHLPHKTEEPPVECEGQIIHDSKYNTKFNNTRNNNIGGYQRTKEKLNNNLFDLLDDVANEIGCPTPEVKRKSYYSLFGHDEDIKMEYNFDDGDLPF